MLTSLLICIGASERVLTGLFEGNLLECESKFPFTVYTRKQKLDTVQHLLATNPHHTASLVWVAWLCRRSSQTNLQRIPVSSIIQVRLKRYVYSATETWNPNSKFSPTLSILTSVSVLLRYKTTRTTPPALSCCQNRQTYARTTDCSICQFTDFNTSDSDYTCPTCIGDNRAWTYWLKYSSRRWAALYQYVSAAL